MNFDDRALFYPEPHDLRAWAQSEHKNPPEWTWDESILDNPENDSVVIELASRDGHPKQSFFLLVLYGLVERYCVAREREFEGEMDLRDRILRALELVGGTNSSQLQRWERRSRKVLEDPAEFDLDDWLTYPSG